MKTILIFTFSFFLISCSEVPDIGSPSFNFHGNQGILYTYNGNKENLIKKSHATLTKVVNIESKLTYNGVETAFKEYSKSNERFIKACRVEIIDSNKTQTNTRINCVIKKYEYGYQAGNSHSPFTKTWWGKNASSLENEIVAKLKNE